MNSDNDILHQGDVIGDYTIVEKLGQGGMCQVYRALDPALERYVAIKIMLEAIEGEEALNEFFEEGRLLAKLRHSNIVPLYSVGVEQGIPWLAMGCIEGKNLADFVVDEREFTLPEAKAFMEQAIAALDYAAKSNLIHLDIKPANFMMDTDGSILLADFGLARRITDVNSGIHDGQPAKGTPAYASPEHFLRGKLDLRTDIYSLGITLFHLITRRLPYPGETALEICSMHLRSPFPVEAMIEANIPSGWQNLISKMVEKKPRDRFQNYDDLRKALAIIDRFKYVREVVSENPSLEGRQSIPQSGGSIEDLFYMIPGDLVAQSATLFRMGTTYTADSVLTSFNSRGPMLNLNKLAGCLHSLQFRPEDTLEDVLASMHRIQGYRESLYRIANFIAEDPKMKPKTDRQAVEIVGLDRSINLGMVARALNTQWQGEMLVNHHNFWENALYTGLLSCFIVDMLGYDTNQKEFVCGITHAIGRLVFMELYPAKNIALWLKALENNILLVDLEQTYYGMNFARIGAEWLRKHDFEPLVYHVIASQLKPENCFAHLEKATAKGFLTKKSPYKQFDVQILAHVTTCASLLCKELGLGYDGCSFLSSTPWLELNETKLLFANRRKKDVTYQDFTRFFLETCRGLPELPILQFATAESAQQRILADKATVLKHRGVITH